MLYRILLKNLRFRTHDKCDAAMLAAATGLAASCLMASQAAADGIAPGEWKVTETFVMNGNKTAPQTTTRCLSPEQARDTAATFSPEFHTMTTPLPTGERSECARAELNSTATALRWRMQCTGQMDMDVSGDFVFDTPKHYTATIVSKGTNARREFVNTSVSIEGEHVGDCR
jgi:hypothetical protein